MKRQPRHVRVLGAVLLLLVGGTCPTVAQQLERPPAPRPVAVTQPSVPPSLTDAAGADQVNRKVIARTRPPAAPPPVQPVATWPELKGLPPADEAKGVVPPLPAVSGAALALRKIGPASAVVGQPVRYEIVVRNVGSETAFQVRLEDSLAAGARYLNGEPRAEVEGGRLKWDLGALDAGAEHRLWVEVQTDGEGQPASGHATVTFSAGGDPPASAVRPKLELTMSGPESIAVGDKVVFRIKLANMGTSPVAKVVLRVQLPDGLKHPEGNEIETEMATLAPGESENIALEVAAVRPGRQVSQASATADGAAPAAAQAVIRVTGLEKD